MSDPARALDQKANRPIYYQTDLQCKPGQRGFRDVTDDLSACVRASGVTQGLAHVFCQHTSASLIICENADPQVLTDLEGFMSGVVQDGDPAFMHRAEGPDDMAAHVRSVLTNAGLTLPVRAGRLALGIWQGVYLWEHRYASHRRQLMVTIHGVGDP